MRLMVSRKGFQDGQWLTKLKIELALFGHMQCRGTLLMATAMSVVNEYFMSLSEFFLSM